MRNGWSPSKQLKNRAKICEVSVGVLNCIPQLAGYHSDGLRVLSLCLMSIRAHADQEFELIVVDNNSCEEVRAYLIEEYEKGLIDILLLNRNNVGINGLLQAFGAASGKYIFFSDWDIYHRKGYMNAQIDLATSFPDVGMVGARPVRHLVDKHIDGSIRALDKNPKIRRESGHYIPEDYLIEFAEQTSGHINAVHPTIKVEQWTQEYLDTRLKFDNRTAYLGSSHMQFLMPRHAIFEMGLHWNEKIFCKADVLDIPLSSKDLLRISTTEPFVDHIGNAITDQHLENEYTRLSKVEKKEAQTGAFASTSSDSEWEEKIWRNPVMRKVLYRLYHWSFYKYSQGTDKRA